MESLTLPEAIERAKKESKAGHGKTKYVTIDDGECYVEDLPRPGATSHCFKGGKEIPVRLEDAITKDSPEKAEPAKEANAGARSERKAKADAVKDANKNKNMKAKKNTKKAKATTAKAPKVAKLIRGNNMALTKEQWVKVDAKLKKLDVSFSTFSRELVLKAVGE